MIWRVLLVGWGMLTVVAAEPTAVTRGLEWLAAQQRVDGTWSTNTGVNALAVLAFASAGHLPGHPPYGAALDRAVRAILAQQGPTGTFTNGGAFLYGHGITTLLLGELAGMVKDGGRLRPRLVKAMDVILRAQQVPKADIHVGGWRYFTTSPDSDLTGTFWQVAALRAAMAAGLGVPAPAWEQASGYVVRCRRADGAFGYQPGGMPTAGRTAAGIVALRLCGQSDTAATERGRMWLRAHPLRWGDEYFYHASFLCALADAGWSPATLQERQQSDGSWPAPPGCRDEQQAGPVYRTAMAVLALTAADRYLPVWVVND
jgi:hypothetical protein